MSMIKLSVVLSVVFSVPAAWADHQPKVASGCTISGSGAKLLVHKDKNEYGAVKTCGYKVCVGGDYKPSAKRPGWAEKPSKPGKIDICVRRNCGGGAWKPIYGVCNAL